MVVRLSGGHPFKHVIHIEPLPLVSDTDEHTFFPQNRGNADGKIVALSMAMTEGVGQRFAEKAFFSY